MKEGMFMSLKLKLKKNTFYIEQKKKVRLGADKSHLRHTNSDLKKGR